VIINKWREKGNRFAGCKFFKLPAARIMGTIMAKNNG
jgi:hypothetical protein